MSLSSFADIHFAWPWVALLLPLPFLVRWFLPPRRSAPGQRLNVPDIDRFEFADASAPIHERVPIGRWLLLLVAWLALLVATGRPQTLGPMLGMPQSGRDLLLAIDVSNSMRQADFPVVGRLVPRMAVVKRVASDFVARRQGDRVGLILFGTQAFVQTPLTRDHRSVQHFLDEAETGLAGQTTAIGDAIGLAVKRLRERPADARVIVLLTDGTNTAGMLDPLVAAKLAAEEGIRIHTIGIGGRQGAFSAFRPGGSEVDEALLGEIAALGGGRSFRASDREELEEIYRTIDAIEPVEMDETQLRPRIELYHWPLALALLLSCIWAWLSQHKSSAERLAVERQRG